MKGIFMKHPGRSKNFCEQHVVGFDSLGEIDIKQ